MAFVSSMPAKVVAPLLLMLVFQADDSKWISGRNFTHQRKASHSSLCKVALMLRAVASTVAPLLVTLLPYRL
jgi:hypothetical protein